MQRRYGEPVRPRLSISHPLPVMLRATLAAVLLVPLAGAGCASPPVPEARVATPDADAPFRLALGDEVERDGHAIRFVEIVEDSRCPEGSQCITEGRARIRLTVDGEAAVLSVPHGRMADDETSTVERGTIQVEVTGLEPAPGVVSDDPPYAVLVTRPSTR